MKKVLEFCAKNGITHKQFYEIMATQALESPATHGFKENMGSRLPHDDMMIFTTKEDIILRLKHNANLKWTRRDDREASKYNDVELRLIDIAIISTIEKKLRGTTGKQPIRSFAYFVPEIESLIAMQKAGELQGGLSDYHRYVLATWEKRIKRERNEKWRINV